MLQLLDLARENAALKRQLAKILAELQEARHCLAVTREPWGDDRPAHPLNQNLRSAPQCWSTSSAETGSCIEDSTSRRWRRKRGGMRWPG